MDVQAEENVIQYRNSPFTNHRKCVTIFPYGKLMEEESTCVHRTTGKSPEDFYIRSSKTERDVQAQMEDGFGEALLNRFKRDERSANIRFNGHRQAVTGPPVIAEGYRACCT